MTNPPAAPAPPELSVLLASFAENLTARATSGNAIDTFEREAEINQVLQALASPLKGRVALIGPARVGKTAIAQAVAARIASGACPPELRGKIIWAFTPTSVPGLSAKGNWQNLLDYLFNRWAHRPEIILYIDEIVRAARLPGSQEDDDGQAIDVATVIATALKRLPGQCLVEAEDSAWRRFAERYPDFDQLFLPVRITPFDLATTRRVAKRVAEDLSILHGVAVGNDAIELALDLSQRYALDKAQPGKTIDILRDALAVAGTDGLAGADSQAGLATEASREPRLSAESVVQRFGQQSGLPRMLLDDSVPFDEQAVLQFFRAHVLGQDLAVEAVVQSLSLLRARVHNPLRPMGVFLFLGPTGVGKTELARTLAEYLYGTRDRLARFNMADYANPFQANELFGNPYSSDVGARRGQLTNRLAGHMFSVIVLDEFEKAAQNIYQRFLQLFDEGLLINGNDELVNLRNAIFILTSNFGARLIEHGRIGFAVSESAESRERRVLSETEAYFTPEFMNRMDAACIFHPLNRSVMADIARREIGDLLQRDGITRRQFEVDIDDEVIAHVVVLGYSPHYGARYLKRQIEKIITYPLAREINARPSAPAGGSIRLFLKHGRVASMFLAPAGPAAAGEAGIFGAKAPSLEEMQSALPVLAARVEALEDFHGVAAATAERDTILAAMADVSFWDDAGAARRKLESFQEASSTVDMVSSLRQALDRLAAGSAAAQPPTGDMARQYKFLLAELPRLEYTSWLSGPNDGASAYIEIRARAKQTAARQWAAELARMYLGWARQRRLTATVIGEDASPEGRMLTLVLGISGWGTYGLLSGESGTHRLVQMVKVDGKESLERLSASVMVLPELNDDALAPAELELKAREISRGGLLLGRLTAQVTVRQAGSERQLGLASNLPADDLALEARRIFQTRLQLPTEPIGGVSAPGELVRTYNKNTKDKGVVDHRTGWRSQKVKQVLEGDIQEALDAFLRQRTAPKP
jgi:ATP-dependent Clp protease ATP-binding subunit ClpC